MFRVLGNCCLATKTLTNRSMHLPQEGWQLSQGGVMVIDQPLLPSQLDGANCSPLNHASSGLQLVPFYYYT